MEIVRKGVQTLWVFLANGFWGFSCTGSPVPVPLKMLCSPGFSAAGCSRG